MSSPKKPTARSRPARATPARPSVIADAPLATDISKAILDFAAPLFEGRHDKDLSDDELDRGVRLAVLAWNAGTPRVPAGTIEWGYEAAEALLGAERWAATRPYFDTMIAARRDRYGDEPRLVAYYEVTHVPGRGRRLDLATVEMKKDPPS